MDMRGVGVSTTGQDHRGGYPPVGVAQTVPVRAPGAAGDMAVEGPTSRGSHDWLGPYRLVQQLGEGGMGVVHLGLDGRGRGVAIKVLRDHVAHDPTARQRLAREVSTLRRVRHPQVAPVLDADVDGARPYVVTRYVPGDPLDAWVAVNGPLTGAALARLGRGLAEALGAIHDAGVVHRDLKPANVLVNGGDPVVIDFGIAHVADETRLTHTGLVMGTPGYLAPELLDGDPVDESTDWWAWAATLAFAATGRAPFGAGPVEAVLHRVYRGEADLRGVDSRLQAVLQAALHPRAAERPGQDAILAALDLYAHGGDTAGVVGEQTVIGASAEATRPVAPPAPADVTQAQAAPNAASRSGDGEARQRAGRTGSWFWHASRARDPAPSHERSADPATAAHPIISTRVLPAVGSASVAGSMPEVHHPYVGFQARAAASESTAAPIDPVPWRRRGIDRAPDAAGTGRPANGLGGWPAGVVPVQAGSVEAARPPASVMRTPHPVPSAPVAMRRPTRGPRRHVVQPALVALLLTLAALAICWPVVAVLVAVGWAVLARTVEASAFAVFSSASERGRRRSDAPLAVLAAPVRAIPALLTTLLVLVPSAIVATGAALGAAAALTAGTGIEVAADSESPLAIGLISGVLVGWWGVAGRGLRRGSRRTMRALTFNRSGALVVTCALLLLAAYLAVRSQASGVTPDWYPLTSSLLDGLVPILPRY